MLEFRTARECIRSQDKALLFGLPIASCPTIGSTIERRVLQASYLTAAQATNITVREAKI